MPETETDDTPTQAAASAAALRDALATLPTEQVSEAAKNLDLMSVSEQLAAINAAGESVPPVVTAAAPSIAAAIEGIVPRMAAGGRLIYVGAGTAGRIGVLDASEIPPTYGTDPSLVVGVMAGGMQAIHTAVENAEDDVDAGRTAMDELEITENDSVIGISASGRTPFVIAAVQRARERGAFTVGFACNPDSRLAAVADLGIETVVGPEVVTGSTRMKAGTAQKLVLNAISTIVMVRLGKVYGNLMVDLRATNEKLRARSQRTVMLATGAEAADAGRALDEAGGWVKAAILIVLTGVDGVTARALLARHDGRLRDAVDDARAASHAG
jgi:N-acetylmuramic acid 6-phosphate etherase